MTNSIASRSRMPVFPMFALLIAGLVAVELWIVSLPLYLERRALFSTAITVDVLVGVPLLAYLMLVRRGGYPRWVIVPWTVIGFVLASLVVPRGDRALLDVAAKIVPLLELGLVLFLAFQARAIVRRFRELRGDYLYSHEALRDAIAERLHSPMAAAALTSSTAARATTY